MIVATGRAVLPIRANGQIGPLGAKNLTIAWAEALTVPVARAFLRSSATVLITREGNPVCHGANLLRVARMRNRRIGWVSGLATIGSGCGSINENGELTILDGDAQVRSFNQEINRAIFEFNGIERVAVCLWPHRFYTSSQIHLQRRGLAKSASALCDQKVVVNADRRGRLWFESGDLDEVMIRGRALDREYSLHQLSRMMASYEGLAIEILHTPVNLLDNVTLERLATTFFEHLLLFHHCYYDVVISAANALSTEIDPSVTLQLASTNAVLIWLFESPRFMDSSKQGTPGEWWGTLPNQSVASACEQTAQTILSGMPELNSEGMLNVMWIAQTMVLKEMKMIIAKNLFAGLSAIESR